MTAWKEVINDILRIKSLRLMSVCLISAVLSVVAIPAFSLLSQSGTYSLGMQLLSGLTAILLFSLPFSVVNSEGNYGWFEGDWEGIISSILLVLGMVVIPSYYMKGSTSFLMYATSIFSLLALGIGFLTYALHRHKMTISVVLREEEQSYS